MQQRNQSLKVANKTRKLLKTVMEILALLSLFFSLWWQNAHYADIMLDAPTIALCPELCQHNLSNPTYVTVQIRSRIRSLNRFVFLF